MVATEIFFTKYLGNVNKIKIAIVMLAIAYVSFLNDTILQEIPVLTK